MRDSKGSLKAGKQDQVNILSVPTPLPLGLKKNGFSYKQYTKGEKAFIYEQWSDGFKIAYEVFIRKIKPESKVKGKILPAREWFPYDEAFGSWAWTYKTFEKAFEKFCQLTKN